MFMVNSILQTVRLLKPAGCSYQMERSSDLLVFKRGVVETCFEDLSARAHRVIWSPVSEWWYSEEGGEKRKRGFVWMAEGPASQGWKTSKHLLYGLISCRQRLPKRSTNYPRGALQNSLSDFISCCPDEVSGRWGGGRKPQRGRKRLQRHEERKKAE